MCAGFVMCFLMCAGFVNIIFEWGLNATTQYIKAVKIYKIYCAGFVNISIYIITKPAHPTNNIVIYTYITYRCN